MQKMLKKIRMQSVNIVVQNKGNEESRRNSRKLKYSSRIVV